MPRITLKLDTDTGNMAFFCNVPVPSCQKCPEPKWRSFCRQLEAVVQEMLKREIKMRNANRIVGKPGNKIVGKLSRTNRKVKLCGSSHRPRWLRTVYKDEAGQLWVRFGGKYWKFPEEVEF